MFCLLGFDSVAAVCVVFGVSRITSGLFWSWKFFTDAGGIGDVQTSHGNDFTVVFVREAKKMGNHLVFLFAVGTADDTVGGVIWKYTCTYTPIDIPKVRRGKTFHSLLNNLSTNNNRRSKGRLVTVTESKLKRDQFLKLVLPCYCTPFHPSPWCK
jgi:hypothetical protein